MAVDAGPEWDGAGRAAGTSTDQRRAPAASCSTRGKAGPRPHRLPPLLGQLLGNGHPPGQRISPNPVSLGLYLAGWRRGASPPQFASSSGGGHNLLRDDATACLWGQQNPQRFGGSGLATRLLPPSGALSVTQQTPQSCGGSSGRAGGCIYRGEAGTCGLPRLGPPRPQITGSQVSAAPPRSPAPLPLCSLTKENLSLLLRVPGAG